MRTQAFGRTMPSFSVHEGSVVRFIPQRSAAPRRAADDPVILTECFEDRFALGRFQRPVGKSRSAAPSAKICQGGDELLAGSGLAGNQHGRRRRADGLDLREDGLQGRGLADDLFEVVLGPQLVSSDASSTATFQGDLVTDQLDFSRLPRRLPGRRVKHRMKRNWIRMYNQDGSVLRVETVINQPDEFRIRRRVRRNRGTSWRGCPLAESPAVTLYQEERTWRRNVSTGGS